MSGPRRTVYAHRMCPDPVKVVREQRRCVKAEGVHRPVSIAIMDPWPLLT